MSDDDLNDEIWRRFASMRDSAPEAAPRDRCDRSRAPCTSAIRTPASECMKWLHGWEADPLTTLPAAIFGRSKRGGPLPCSSTGGCCPTT